MIKQLFLITLAVFGFFLLLTYFWQRSLIYLPVKKMPKLSEFQANDMHEVHIKTADGLSLLSWYKPARFDKPTILYFHGNAGHIGYRVPLIRDYMKEGYGVFLLEYRGYGGNPGRPTEQGLYEDGRAAINYLLQEGVKPSQIVLFGESLGTGVATKIATEQQVCAVILQSPFTSLVELSRYHYPWAFLKPWDRYDSLQRMEAIKAPLLVAHGKRDQIVPFKQGLTIYESAKEPKQLIVLERGHNDLWSDAYSKHVHEFINKHC
ncbi:alpha/beta hydrolase [Legionella impletisoli]|uniref:Alpha/beta hydrolase n=1 Tax=Legionella impletisoli TaxID=343510 RepID=A0A917JUA2_9GAMM|nr:alpha/beta hydrolase [Legionella impletisoli]GGI87406.1 alpha/beta hydrolase [Legionella impletisoli]